MRGGTNESEDQVRPSNFRMSSIGDLGLKCQALVFIFFM